MGRADDKRAVQGPKAAGRFDERLRQLERELNSVDQEIKVLGKAVQRPEEAAELLRQRDWRGVSPSAGSAAGRLAPRAVGAAAEPEPRREPAANSTTELSGRPAAAPVDRDPRFASYLTAGSIDSTRPLRQERRIQRNRAIVMLVVMALLLIWVLRVLT
jgi:hypothetical protein